MQEANVRMKQQLETRLAKVQLQEQKVAKTGSEIGKKVQDLSEREIKLRKDEQVLKD